MGETGAEIIQPGNSPEISKSEAKKGCYGSVDEALGQSLDGLRLGEFDRHLDPEITPPGTLKNLADFWGKSRIDISYPETGGQRVLIEKPLEDGRSVVAVIVPDEELATYKFEKLIFVGPEGKCVNFLERIPEEVRVKITVEEKEKPEDSIENNDDKFFFRPTTSEIYIGQINSFLKTAGVWHEGGHAVSDSMMSNEEKEGQNAARKVFKTFYRFFSSGELDKTKGIEERIGMDYQTARFLIANEERLASLWAQQDLKELSEFLAIDYNLADQICDMHETFWQSYDEFLMPETGVSVLAKEIYGNNAELIEGHYDNYNMLRYWLEEHGVKPGDQVTFKLSDDGQYQAELTENGVMVFSFLPENVQNPQIIGSVAPFGSHISSILGAKKEEVSIVLKDPKLFKKYMKDSGQALEVESFFEEALIMGLVDREQIAREDIAWLKETFKTCIPSVERLDPLAFAEWLLNNTESDISSQHSDTQSKAVNIATSPLKRKNEFCRNIGRRIMSDASLSAELLFRKFDPASGKKLKDDWDRLVLISKTALEKINPPEEVPVPGLSADPAAAERKILEMTAKYLAKS